MIRHIAILVLASLNKVMPKRRTALIFGSQDYAPNAVAISNALSQHTNLRIIMLMRKGTASPPVTLQLSDRLTIRKYRSPAGIWSYVTSRYVFLTHGIWGNRFWSRRQVVVMMWHGMPMKRVIALEGNRPPQGLDYVVASGPFWTNILSEAFNIDPARVLPTGIPRSDLLLAAREQPHVALSSLPGIAEGDRVIVWLPTYRQSVIGEIRLDGIEMGNELQIHEDHFASLDKAFQRVGVKCIVKAHPMSPRYRTRNHENLLFMDNADLLESSIDLYSVLGLCDGLITDISSVWVDFLATGRPMLFFFPDSEAYEANRGLILDNYADFVPGPFVTNPEDLPDAIQSVFSSTTQPRERSARIEDLNMATDTNSSLRLLQSLGIARDSHPGDE